MKAPRLLEKEIVKTCVEFMRLDGWRAVKMEPLSRKEWGKGSGEKSMPDWLFVRYGGAKGEELLWVEFKSARGRLSQGQKDWHALERARGARVAAAKEDFLPSIEGFAAWYRDSGLLRNPGLRLLDAARRSRRK